MEDRSFDGDPFTSVEVDLVSEVVDQEVAVAPPGERDERWNHLDPRSNRQHQVGAFVERQGGGEDVVPHHGDRAVPSGPDVDRPHLCSARGDHLCRGKIPADPDFHHIVIPGPDVVTHHPLNTFNGPVHRTYAMRFTLYWDHRSPQGLQRPVQRAIEGILGVESELFEEDHLMLTGFDLVRRQYNAEALLSRLDAVQRRRHECSPLLLVIPDDIFAPREEFVYGLARPGHGTAVLSTARLANEFYGRQPSEDDLVDRIVKEGSHEIGHLLGLSHCTENECVMFAPHTFDELDRKRKMVCPGCAARLHGGDIGVLQAETGPVARSRAAFRIP